MPERTRAFLLSLVGLIHAENPGLTLTPETWGYLIVTVLLLALGLPAELRRRATVRSTATEAPLEVAPSSAQ